MKVEKRQGEKRQGDIILNRSEVNKILCSDSILDNLAENVYCVCQPKGSTVLINYEIKLIPGNDIIIQGKCKHCGKTAARYIEIESKESRDIANNIREIKKKFKVVRKTE